MKLINGERLTRESVVDRHAKLVHSICHRILPRARALELDYDDILSMGFIGLIKAFDTFNPKYKVRFSTYAYPVIEGAINNELRDMHVGIRYSRKMVGIACEIENNELINRPVEEIAKTLNENPQNVVHAIRYLTQRKPTSFFQIIYEDGNECLEVVDMVGKQEDTTSVYVDEFLGTLTKQEKFIVEMLMAGYTQNYIGKKIGVSQVQVSRIRKRIQNKYLEDVAI